jgi:hypothetical protein
MGTASVHALQEQPPRPLEWGIGRFGYRRVEKVESDDHPAGTQVAGRSMSAAVR